MSERFENDLVLGAYLKEAGETPAFEAQIALENRMLEAARERIESLKLDVSSLSLEYVRYRSWLDAIKHLQSMRIDLIEQCKNKNRSPALKENQKSWQSPTQI